MYPLWQKYFQSKYFIEVEYNSKHWSIYSSDTSTNRKQVKETSSVEVKIRPLPNTKIDRPLLAFPFSTNIYYFTY